MLRQGISISSTKRLQTLFQRLARRELHSLGSGQLYFLVLQAILEYCRSNRLTL